ncbi:NfeD family protein [Gracilibacillus xinjiangensis]|uniref:NfeD family protein n=1 Tax=Gracilibacillus xinjiangensis TaxID=1193282 RepID=A0ABV8WRI4_9BACI
MVYIQNLLYLSDSVEYGNLFVFPSYLFNKEKGGGLIGALDIYWWLLWGSLAIALISLFLGNILDGILESVFDTIGDFFNPLLVFGTLAVIAGSGVLLTNYTGLGEFYVLAISILFGLGAYFFIYYFLVIPMSNAESSTSISIFDLEGKIGEVITTIPGSGMGEVFVASTSGSRSETAVSFDQVEIKQGKKVVIVEVKDHILLVSEIDEF